MDTEYNVTAAEILPLVELRSKYRSMSITEQAVEGKHLSAKYYDGCEEIFESRGFNDFTLGFSLADIINGALRFNPNSSAYEIAVLVEQVVNHVPEF